LLAKDIDEAARAATSSAVLQGLNKAEPKPKPAGYRAIALMQRPSCSAAAMQPDLMR